MDFIIDYCIRRKSDNALMQIEHVQIGEDVILEMVKEHCALPPHLNDDKYEIANITIDEVRGLN